MDGNGCVSESLYDTILLRPLWTVENDVYGLTCNVRENDIIGLHMLEHLLNTFTNVFCQYCPRREGLRRWSSAEEHLPIFLGVAHHHIRQEENN